MSAGEMRASALTTRQVENPSQQVKRSVLVETGPGGGLSVAFKAGGVRVKTPGAEQSAARPELRALALAALALALLAVVGLASSGSAWHGPRAASAPTTALQGIAAAGGVVLVVALLLLWVETPTARPLRRKRRTLAGDEFDELGASLWAAGKTAAVVLLAVAVFCFAALPLLSRGPARQTPTFAHPSVPAGPPRGEGRRSADSVNLGWLLLPIAVALTILTPAAVLIRRRRLKRDEAAHAEEPGALGRAMRASIAALESERDPRKAILRAYARMEQAFWDVEIVRARDETASEFLGRTMRRLQVSAGAAAALTERFEEVRYSTHQITETDRAQALASLHRVERELRERP